MMITPNNNADKAKRSRSQSPSRTNAIVCYEPQGLKKIVPIELNPQATKLPGTGNRCDRFLRALNQSPRFFGTEALWY